MVRECDSNEANVRLFSMQTFRRVDVVHWVKAMNVWNYHWVRLFTMNLIWTSRYHRKVMQQKTPRHPMWIIVSRIRLFAHPQLHQRYLLLTLAEHRSRPFKAKTPAVDHRDAWLPLMNADEALTICWKNGWRINIWRSKIRRNPFHWQ